jgi:hypothetical protein
MTQALPSARISAPPTRLEKLYPKGSWVRLKVCPDAEAGKVVGFNSTRILVSWPEPAYLGHHRPETLELVSTPAEAQTPTEKPANSQQTTGGQEMRSQEAA